MPPKNHKEQAFAHKTFIRKVTIKNQIPQNSQKEPETETTKAQIPKIEPTNKHNPKQAQEHKQCFLSERHFHQIFTPNSKCKSCCGGMETTLS